MDALVVDLTHGGVKIAVELRKLGDFENIYAYDIYNTLENDNENLLNSYNIIIIKNHEEIVDIMNNLYNFHGTDKPENNGLLIVNPIHSPFNFRKNTHYQKNIQRDIQKDIQKDIQNNFVKEISHHNAVALILANWKKRLGTQKIPIIEVTGVKGKTSVVAMLKEILREENPLVLSSLGACIYKNGKRIVLKKNISITPASILETINLAKKVANHNCNTDFVTQNDFEIDYGSCIFENSLGVTGLGDVGVLTNIVENYSIAKNNSNAKRAKSQVFSCNIVVAEKETLNKYYSKESIDFKDKINIFSLDNSNNSSSSSSNNNSNNNCYNVINPKNGNDINHDYNKFNLNDSNLYAANVKYGMVDTSIDINYHNLKTVFGNNSSGSLSIETFAPGKHQVLNVLATLTAALSLEIDEEIIKKVINNFKGINGRTSQKIVNGFRIVEEINPGINIKAIEKSIEMINDLENYFIIIGGKYGITCEEIDEKELAMFLENILSNLPENKKESFNLILTDELGKGIEKNMKNKVTYINDPFEAQKLAIDNEKNVLFIYRSNYSQLNKR